MILRQHYKAQKQNVVDQRLQPRNMCISQAAKLLLLCQPSMMGRTLKRRLTQVGGIIESEILAHPYALYNTGSSRFKLEK